MKRMLARLALIWAVPAGAQVAPPPVVATLPGPTPAAVLLQYRDVASRMTVPVTIDRAGPWNFVVDTGAERTVVSRELAATLGLAPGPRTRVIAITGPAAVATVVVPSLAISSIAARGIVSPALAARDLGALGLVGIDALQGHSVVIDFDRQRMTLKPSRKRRRPPPAPGDVVVTAKSLYGQLIVTDARWRGRRISVVVDTGTPVSVGNLALARLMTDARPAGTVSLVSATGELLLAEMVRIRNIQVGGVGFADIGMAIADAAPFARFGLADTPALLMGMDLLRLFRGVQIDFANREIRFTMPRGARPDGAAITGL